MSAVDVYKLARPEKAKCNHVCPAETLLSSSHHLDHLLQAEQQARKEDCDILDFKDIDHIDQLWAHNSDCCFSVEDLLSLHELQSESTALSGYGFYLGRVV